MYRGIGVERDLELALNNYGEAAAQGHVFSMDMLGYLYQNGEGVERDLSAMV